jgi:hypothetical protein
MAATKTDRFGQYVTAFKSEYCQDIIAHCAAGGSIASFGGTVSVTRRTVYHWREQYPEFDAACDVALQLALFHSEKAHLRLSDAGEVARGHEFRMKNMAKEFWRERQETAVTGEDGGPVKYQLIERRIVDPVNRDG